MIIIVNGRKESSFYRLWFRPPDLRLFMGKSGRESLQFEGNGVVKDIRITGKGSVLLIKTPGSEAGLIRASFPEGKECSIKAGSRVRFSGTLVLVKPPANPGEFDWQSYYDSQGVFLMLRDLTVLQADPPRFSFSDLSYRIRVFLHEGIQEGLTESDRAFVSSVLLGIHEESYAELSDEFSDFLMIRVLLQSGFHLTLLASFLERVLRKLQHRPFLRAVLVFSICFCYASVSGFSVSFTRALLLVGLRSFAPVFCRKFDLLSGAFLVLLLLLLFQPGALFTSAVQVYLAVLLALGVTAPLALEYFRKSPAFFSTLIRILSLQMCMTPVQIMKNCTSSLFSPLLSLAAMLPAGMILSSGFAGAFLSGAAKACRNAAFRSLLLKAGKGFFGTSHYMLAFYKAVKNLLSKIPGAVVVNGKPSLWLFLFFMFLASLPAVYFAACLRVRKYRKEEEERIPKNTEKIVFVLVFLLIFAAEIFFLRTKKLSDDELRIVMLDVGQGDCFLVSSGEEHYIVDCGSSTDDSIGRKILLPALKYYGIGSIRGLLLSHGDLDHTNAAPALLNSEIIRTEALILSGHANWQKDYESVLSELPSALPLVLIHEGECVLSGSLALTCLSPPENAVFKGNDASMVLLLEHPGARVLFTGDISSEIEKSLLPIGDIDLLKAPHHGSEYSSSSEFLEDLRAETVFVSCGRNNTYGHPGKGTMNRYREAKMKVFQTPEDGAVSITYCKGKPAKIRCFAVEKDDSLWYNPKNEAAEQ